MSLNLEISVAKVKESRTVNWFEVIGSKIGTRNLAIETDHPILDDNFKILDTCDPFDLRLLESIYIHKKKPSLNDQNSSTELSILC